MIKGLKTIKYKNFLLDIIINLIGTGFPLVMLQLLVYPIIAQKISAEAYGKMQSIVSVVYLISGTIGSALSATRLIKEYEYREKNLSGDFHILDLLSSVVVLIVTPCIINLYLGGDIQRYDLILITAFSVLNYIVLYYGVGFRLNLDYKAIFINKIYGCIGYFVGFLFFLLTAKWQYVFIGSCFLQAIQCVRKTNLRREGFNRTVLFIQTSFTYINLNITNLLSKALTYFDKLLLYPLLGGETVSIYFAANIFGKLILQILEPITNVILSYLSRKKDVSKQMWKMLLPCSFLFCGLMYILCLIISKPILALFYPQWAEAAMELIPISTLSLCVSSLANIIYPFTLKTLESNKQIIINGVGLLVYIMLVLELYNKYSLRGCCFALLASYISKLILMFFFVGIKNKNLKNVMRGNRV